MKYLVMIHGRKIPIHAKNEKQLEYAVKAMTDAVEKNPKILEQYDEQSTS